MLLSQDSCSYSQVGAGRGEAMLTSLSNLVKFNSGILFNSILDVFPVQYLLFKQQEEKQTREGWNITVLCYTLPSKEIGYY